MENPTPEDTKERREESGPPTLSNLPKKSVKKNYFYNLLYQAFLVIVPLIVTPYLSRVLQSDGIGQNSFVLSVNSYFTLFAALGFGYYAQREIAKNANNKQKQSELFWEILIIRSLSTFLSLLIYFLLLLFLPAFNDYKALFLVYAINIFSVSIDTTFLFQGNEDFKQIAVRNLIVKTLTIVAIFVFVRKKQDVWIYALISALGVLISAIIMMPFLPRYLIRVKGINPWRHILPAIRLFIPTIAISIYTTLDKTMIGFLIPGEVTIIKDGVSSIAKIADIENGYYQQSDKIIKMLLMVITALGAVMIPRNTEYFHNGLAEKAKENIYSAIRFVFFLGVPLTFGVLAIANSFCPWFFGSGYEKVPSLMMLMSPLILLIGCSNVFGVQYMVPSERDKAFVVSIVCGAVTNLLLNYFLIKGLASYGAAIASVISECVVTLVQIIVVRRDFCWKRIFLPSWRYWVAGGIMFCIVFFSSRFLPQTFWATLCLFFAGLISYFGVVLLLRDDLLLYGVKTLSAKFFGKRKKQNSQKLDP